MDFGLIALILFVGSKVLDYAAPKTKNTWDDKVRAAVHWLIPLLPAAKEAKARAVAPAPAANKPAPAPQAVTGFNVRDHR
jgi:hypothetical protein